MNKINVFVYLILTVILCITFGIKLQSQQIPLFYGEEFFEFQSLHIEHVFETAHGDIICILDHVNEEETHISKYMIILDERGNINSNIPLSRYSDQPFAILFFDKWKDGYILDIEQRPLISNYPYDRNETHIRIIYILDSDFEIIDSMSFSTPGVSFGNGSSIIEDEYYFVRTIGTRDRFLCNFGKLSQDDELNTFTTRQQYLWGANSLTKNISKESFLIYTFRGVLDISVQNDTLIGDRIDEIHLNRGGHVINDTNKYFVHGVHGIWVPGFGSIYQLMYKVFDVNYNLMYHDTTGLWPSGESYWNWPANRNSIAFSKSNNDVYTSGNLLVTLNGYNSKALSSFYIAKYKEGTDRQWYHIFGMDANYWIMGVTATIDGGCMVYGWRRDPDTGIRYPYLLKLNEDGLTTSTSEATLPLKPEVKIYGNPSSQLTFEVLTEDGWNGKAYLIDMNGRLIHQENLTNTRTTMNIMSLSTGTYMLLILDTYGRVLTQEKWVKVE